MPVVYCATNVMNGKKYIGATKFTIEKRMVQHINSAKRISRSTSRFYAALRKYGSGCFYWEVLSKVDSSNAAFLREKALIAVIKPEYNIREGGRSEYVQIPPNRRRIICLEDNAIFESMCAAASHYGSDPSTLASVVRAGHGVVCGKHFTLYERDLTEPECHRLIEKIELHTVRKRKRGCKKLITVVAKNGKDVLGRSAAGPMKNARPVICISDDIEFPSASSAASYYNVPKSALIELCLGKNHRRTVSGKIFAYKKMS